MPRHRAVALKKNGAPKGAAFVLRLTTRYFFGASRRRRRRCRRSGAGAVAGRAAGAAAIFISFMKSSNVDALPALTTPIGTTLPSFSVKIVISAFLRSPFSSNSILPVAPL